MDRRQVEVFALLKELSADRDQFHNWYFGAVEVLNSASPDKIAQAANSIREICDRLPARIANIPQPKSVVAAAKNVGPDFIKIKKSGYIDGWEGKQISASLGGMLLRLENIFTEPPRTKRLKSALTLSDPQRELLSRRMREQQDAVFDQLGTFFQSVTHHYHLATEAEFREHLQLFEFLLLNYLTQCTASQQNELLALITGLPTVESFRRVNELIRHKGANYAFFFDKLDNPNWLSLLDQEGYFSDLPGPEPIEDGRVVFRHHLPLMVLVRLAAVKPQTVTDLLLKLRLPDNPTIGDQILQCIAKLQNLECVQRLDPLILQLGKSTSRTSWLYIQEVLKSWLELKAFKQAFSLIRAFLHWAVQMPSNQYRSDSNDWLVKQVDELFLDPLTNDHPIEVGSVIFEALRRWAEQRRTKYPKSELSDDAPLSYLQEDFKSPSPSHRGFENSLAIRLFLVFKQINLKGDLSKIEEIDNLLLSHNWQLFRRLRWQIYADFPAAHLARARREVVNRIPSLGEMDYNKGAHDYEFAQLLRIYSDKYRDSFLTPEEVVQFFDSVLKGPVNHQGEFIDDYKEVFWRKQLWPISTILNSEQLKFYRTLVPDDKEIDFEAYKPHRFGGSEAHFVRQIAPPEADALASLSDEAIWEFVNTWKPKTDFEPSGRWVEQDIFALGTKVALLVEVSPERFNPSTEWWKHVKRWEILNKFLDRGSERIRKDPDEKSSRETISEIDWANWLGILKWLAGEGKLQKWPQHAAADFAKKALASKQVIPDFFLSEIFSILKALVEAEDSRLDSGDNSFHDWLTTAINSTRGDAIDALMALASRQKQATGKPDALIFELIKSRLELSSESPAIFALLGANLAFFVHLFEEEVVNFPNLIFPRDRSAHCYAAIEAHFKYSRPWNKFLKLFPQFINAGLAELERLQAEAYAKKDATGQRDSDFGSQFGIHIACYYWNGSFADENDGEKALEHFFVVAPQSTRAAVINQIASIWQKPSKEVPEEITLKRVMRIWEKRHADIAKTLNRNREKISDYENEIAESIDWLNCECFPFIWRCDYAEKALGMLRKAPRSYLLLKAICEFGLMPDRLERVLKLFQSLLQKPSDELRWSIQVKELAPVLKLGFASQSPSTKRYAESCKDLLLKMGFFEFLNIGNNEQV